MKVLILLLLFLVSCSECKETKTIIEVGTCTKATFLNSSVCRVVYENNSRDTLYAPVMVGDKVYVDPMCGRTL